MRLYSTLIFLLVIVSPLNDPGQLTNAQTNLPEARKVDEFGDAQYSDIAARLDSFAQELQRTPEAHAFLIAYRSRRDLPGLSSRLVNWLKDYLVNTRGFAADRIVAIDGGVAGCVTQELWLVPPGATPKPRTDAYATQIDDFESPRKFDEGPFYVRGDYPESYAGHISHSLEGFSEALRKQPQALAYLIGYAGYRTEQWEEPNARGKMTKTRHVYLDSPAVVRKALNGSRSILVKDYKISSSRIKLINGGYREWRGIELWIVPRGHHAPIPAPNAFPWKHR